VAVLPFETLGHETSDRTLAAALHGELLLKLAQLRELRVISRTSVQVYVPGEHSLRQVAHDLRAGSVIEGSVQRIGNHLRIRLQLIDTSSETHLWVDSFLGDEEQALAQKARAALAIARALGLRPSAEEVAGISEPLSAVPTALAAFREALLLWHAGGNDERMAELFEEALALDPGIHAAHGYLAAYRARSYAFAVPEAKPNLRAAAEAHLVALRDHAADSPSRFLAEGTYRYYIDHDREAALVWLERARAGFPNTPSLLTFIASAQYAGGRFEDALANYREATLLDPRYPAAAINYMIRLEDLWRFEEAHAEGERILGLVPDCDECRFWWIRNLYAWSGDPADIERHLHLLSNASLRASHALWAAVARRDVELALALAAGPEQTYLESIWALPRNLHAAAIYMQAGAGEEGRDALLAALPRFEDALAAGFGLSPGARRVLAEALIQSGRCADALTLMREAAPLLPGQWHINPHVGAATVELRCGEVAAARRRMQAFFESAGEVVSGISPALLLSYPATDALAQDPAIRALIEARRDGIPPPPSFSTGARDPESQQPSNHRRAVSRETHCGTCLGITQDCQGRTQA
jgi:TolB-like protein